MILPDSHGKLLFVLESCSICESSVRLLTDGELSERFADLLLSEEEERYSSDSVEDSNL